jgi:hypothetical protein
MYFDTQIEYEDQLMNDYIEKEMHKVKKSASRKLSKTFVHPKLLNEFALTLAYGYFDSCDYAEKITEALDLSKLDFLAIQEDLDAFKEEYLKNYHEARNF